MENKKAYSIDLFDVPKICMLSPLLEIEVEVQVEAALSPNQSRRKRSRQLRGRNKRTSSRPQRHRDHRKTLSLDSNVRTTDKTDSKTESADAQRLCSSCGEINVLPQGDGEELEGRNVDNDDDCGNVAGKQVQEVTQTSSLFRSATTPTYVRWFIPLLVLANMALFYVAQLMPMWNLTQIVDITMIICANTPKSQAAADVLNLPYDYTYTRQEHTVIETYTFMDAIRRLWTGQKLEDAKDRAKNAAAFLMIVSGILPHLKLFLLLVCWFLPFVHKLRITNEVGYIRYKRSLMSRRVIGFGVPTESSDANESRCNLIICSNGHHHSGIWTLRTPFLRTLNILGKLALTVIFVVCILAAALNLDWEINPDQIHQGVEDNLPKLMYYVRNMFPDIEKDCTSLLEKTCGPGSLAIYYAQCIACEALIVNSFSNTDWTTSEGREILDGISLDGSGGHIQLRVVGLAGTHYFCVAIIASILLSLAVDFFDEKDRAQITEELSNKKRELTFNPLGEIDEVPSGSGTTTYAPSAAMTCARNGISWDTALIPTSSYRRHRTLDSESTMRSFVSAARSHISTTSRRDGDMYVRLNVTPYPTTNSHLLKRVLLIILSITSFPLVLYAIALPTMQRILSLGIPELLENIFVLDWERYYSIVSMMIAIGDDTGRWNLLPVLTFGLFAIVGPFLRSTCLLLHVLLGLPESLLGIERLKCCTSRLEAHSAMSKFRKTLVTVIDMLGYFCCLEVLIGALIMIEWEIKPITNTIFKDESCKLTEPDLCIALQFSMMDAFLIVVVACFFSSVAHGLTMDLASNADSQLNGLEQDENCATLVDQPGQPCEPKHLVTANLSRNQVWHGTCAQEDADGNSFQSWSLSLNESSSSISLLDDYAFENTTLLLPG